MCCSVTMDIVLITVLILAVFFVESSGWRPFTIGVGNASYENFRPEEMGFNVTTNNNSFDLNVNIIKDISQLSIDCVVEHDSGGGNFDMVYANQTIDVCWFLRNRKSNALVDLTFKVLEDFGNIPKACPIRKKLYTYLNATIDPEKVPPFLPDHAARLSVAVWNKVNGNRRLFVKARGYLTVKRSFKRKGGRG